MKDIYVEKFSAVLDEIHTFKDCPRTKIYVSCLLADHVERTGFFTEPVGLRYMDLQTSTHAKELGDNCLVLVGIFPGYRGMPDDYYIEIGRGSYGMAASVTGSDVFEILARDFDIIRRGLNQLRPPTFL